MLNKDVFVIYLLFWVIPGLTVVFAWWRFIAHRDSITSDIPNIAVLFMVVTTISYIWFFTGGFFSSVLGSDYSQRRSVTILGNIAVCFTIFVISLMRKSVLRLPNAVTAGTVTLAWLYSLVVGSAV